MENRRLVERERLDIAPTGVLGLFVVGRLARRHSLNVGLVNTPGGGITALLAIPPQLFSSHAGSRHRPEPARQAPAPRRAAPPGLRTVTIPPPRSPDDGFVWFELATPAAVPESDPAPDPASTPWPDIGPAHPSTPGPEHEPVVAARGGPADPSPSDTTGPVVLSIASPSVVTPANDGRQGLRRRVPGAQLPATVGAPTRHSVPERTKHNAIAARSEMDDYQSALAEADRRRDPRTSGNQPAGHQQPAPQPPSIASTTLPRHAARRPRDTTPTTSSPVGGDSEQRGGLTRRRPGTHLAPALQHQPEAGPVGVTNSGWDARRDAEAERRAFDAFAAGFAQADAAVDTAAPGDGGNGHEPGPMKESTR